MSGNNVGMPFCINHPNRRARASCAFCGSYICEDCLREEGGRAVCAACPKHQPGHPRITSYPSPSFPPAEACPASREEGANPGEKGTAPNAGAPGQVGATIYTYCFFHPGARAVARCSRCGSFICSTCRRELGGRHYCPSCHYPLTLGNSSGAIPMPSTISSSSLAMAQWRLWPGLLFLPAPFLLEGAVTYMMNKGGEVSLGGAVFFLSTLLYSLFLLFAITVVNRYEPPAAALGLRRRGLKTSLAAGMIGGTVSFWISVALAALSLGLFGKLAWLERWLQGLRDLNIKSGVSRTDLLIVFLIVVLAAPLCEEIFFRGYLYPPMRNALGIGPAIFLNGLLFSLVHFSLFGLFSRIAAGCVFCYLYEYKEDLFAPITAHAINNFIAFMLPLIAPQALRVIGGL